MTKKRRTRRALINSVISLLICFSMLLGTTFAWFTDEVTTGMNTINAGKLDVELLADGVKVDSTTKLFDDVELWEPGVVTYENLQVANVGTLALKYQMTLNFGNENNLNGHKLSEVLKVAVIDKIADDAKRTDVLAAAKAAENVGTLSNFLLRGELLPKGETDATTGKSDKSPEQTVVIFWEPNENTIDNRYNANNDQKTSDGKPLHIEFGVNLQATQLMHEEDSFGNDYDKFAGFEPVANVNGSTELTIPVVGIDNVDKITLDTAYQFQPTETYEEAQESPYRYYHADFVVSADEDIPANSVALAGYYKLYCDNKTGGAWVALTSPDAITAGTEIRLIESMGDGVITVNYEELCQFGNDDTGFLCGVVDMTGENAGTTITVELRLYETTKAPDATSGTANEETGEYITVGKYEYTFEANEVSTADELATILTKDWENINVALANDIDLPITSLGSITSGSGEYKLGSENTENITIDLNGNKLNITTTYWSAIGAKNDDAKITIKNGSMTSTGNSAGTWNAYDVRFSNCDYLIENVTFDKAIALDNAGKTTTLKNVTINETHDYYALWITAEGQTVTADGLTVNSDGRGIKIDEQYVDSPSTVTLEVSNATFDTAKKAAIMVKSAAGAAIALSNVDISNVAADNTNAVWVDADATNYSDLVSVSGGSIIDEP
ncbi:MAG: hypothetical protein IJ374_07065 [Lachnospiraceae bacterium]|nr:hypothetical protein [Lachnospiraceae bacterium]